MLSEHFGCSEVFENFEDNPYLKNFYEDQVKHAFPLELYFMAERYQQQNKLFDKINLFQQKIISDYAFFKSLIFANITLKGDELQLFKMLFHIIHPNIKSPDIILYLHKPTEHLLNNIKSRGRAYESNIEANYLERLNSAYMEFFKQQTNSKIIILDTSGMDFVKNSADFNKIIQLFEVEYDKKLNFL